MSTLSPCVRICIMDPDSGLCEGCGRTLDEIAAWSGMAENDRRAVMAVLPKRLAAMKDTALNQPPWRPAHND